LSAGASVRWPRGERGRPVAAPRSRAMGLGVDRGRDDHRDRGVSEDGGDVALLKQRCRDDLRLGFARALASLTPRERTLLRQHYVDGLTVDVIVNIGLDLLARLARRSLLQHLVTARAPLFLGVLHVPQQQQPSPVRTQPTTHPWRQTIMQSDPLSAVAATYRRVRRVCSARAVGSWRRQRIRWAGVARGDAARRIPAWRCAM
jgi:hypothetical protein